MHHKRSVGRRYGSERTRETITGYPVGTDLGRYIKSVAQHMEKHGPRDLVDAVIQTCAPLIAELHREGYDPEYTAAAAINRCTTIMGRLRPYKAAPVSIEKRYGVRRDEVRKQTVKLLEEAYMSDPARMQEAVERITGQHAFVLDNLTTKQLSAIRTVAMSIVMESRGSARSRDRSAPFAPPKFVGHRERTSETVGGYPVGTDFGYYVRATARELEKLVRHMNPALAQKQVDYTVTKSLMRCSDRMQENFGQGHDPKWSAGNVYRMCTAQIYWPWGISPAPTQGQKWPDFAKSKRGPSHCAPPCRIASVTTWKYKAKR